MGRYLQAETSYADFNWPNSSSSIGNPMDVTNAVSIQSTAGLVTAFQGPIQRGGPRRVEDVLMSNVREFKIELWDSRLERWVVPGHTSVRRYSSGGNVYPVAGDYHLFRNAQLDPDSGLFTYGPLEIPSVNSGIPHVFDTWHPQIARDFDGDGLLVEDIAERQAPYYPLKYYPPRQSDSPPGPTSGTIPLVNPATEFDPVAQRVNANRGFWDLNTAYQVGDVVFARKKTTVPGWNDNAAVPNNKFEWIADKDAIPAQSIHVAYRCVGTTNGSSNGTSNSTNLPAFQSPGLRFQDGDLLWEGFQNYQPLKSVRLTISFIEPNSETPKQLTLVLPLTDAAQ